MPQVFTNGAACKLGATIATTSPIATLTLEASKASLFPQPTGADWFVLTLIKADYSAFECFRCTARVGAVVTVATRAYDGTAANTWSTSDLVVCSPNAGALADLRADLVALQSSMSSANSAITSLQSSVASIQTNKPDMALGTKALFYQAAAPTGWTLDTSVNDRVLRVSNTAGGSVGGSWTISGLTVQGTALDITQIPGHTHTDNYMLSTTNYFSGGNFVGYSIGPAGTTTTGSTGGGQAHAHGITHTGAWRPAYADAIVCSRSA